MSNADFDTRHTSPGTRPTTAKPAENGRKHRRSVARSAQPQEIAQRDTPNTTTRHHRRQPKTPVSTGDSLSVQPAPRVPSKELHPAVGECLQAAESRLGPQALAGSPARRRQCAQLQSATWPPRRAFAQIHASSAGAGTTAFGVAARRRTLAQCHASDHANPAGETIAFESSGANVALSRRRPNVILRRRGANR